MFLQVFVILSPTGGEVLHQMQHGTRSEHIPPPPPPGLGHSTPPWDLVTPPPPHPGTWSLHPPPHLGLGHSTLPPPPGTRSLHPTPPHMGLVTPPPTWDLVTPLSGLRGCARFFFLGPTLAGWHRVSCSSCGG